MGRHAAGPADDAPSGLAAGVDDSDVGDAVGANGVEDAGTGLAVGADVRVVSGNPSPEELAAVIAVLQRQADEAAAAGRAEVTESPAPVGMPPHAVSASRSDAAPACGAVRSAEVPTHPGTIRFPRDPRPRPGGGLVLTGVTG